MSNDARPQATPRIPDGHTISTPALVQELSGRFDHMVFCGIFDETPERTQVYRYFHGQHANFALGALSHRMNHGIDDDEVHTGV